MLLVVAIHLLQLLQISMAELKNNYHITLRNLRTGVLQGFMLAGGDTPYMVQGVDNIAQRVQDGEILYSDFTNSRVFAQENWSEGISKYWDPEKNGYYIFPSKKYKDKKNIEIIWEEFRLGYRIKEVFTFSKWEWITCRWELWGIVYLADWMKIYKSEDYWDTFTLFKDLNTEKYLTGIVDEITDIKVLITNPFTKTHTWELATVSIWMMKQLWVCMYNRSTNHTEVARYDISDTIKSYSWTTNRKSYTNPISAAYSSRRTNLKVDTTIPTWSISWFLHQYTYNPWTWAQTKTFFFVSTWTCASNKLFPGQKFKATRQSTWVTYNCVVQSWGWWYSSGWSSPNEMNISGIPSYSVTYADNQYTITDIGYDWSLCLPITEWWIELFIAVWLGLWQTFSYLGEKFFIDGLWNGISSFWNQIASYSDDYQPASSISQQDYVIISKVWWWVVKGFLANIWNQDFILDRWVTSTGNYTNNITKFVNVSNSDVEHLWWVNHLNPHNKLYDVAYGEIATNLKDSMIYSMSWIWGIASPQNHTYEFDNGMCPISGIEYPYGEVFGIMWIWTQNSWTDGTESRLIRLPLNANQTKPTFEVKATLPTNGITAITYFQGKTYLATKKKWEIYEYANETAVITKLAQLPLNDSEQAYLDDITIFWGNVVVSSPTTWWVFNLDLTSRQNANPLIEMDPLCAIVWVENKRIYDITNTGWNLLFSCENGKVYSYNVNNFSEEWYLESSIYGGYISNVDKLWVYGYVRVEKWTADDWQKVALEVSFDQWKKWQFVPTLKSKNFIDTLDWNNSDYVYSYTNWNEQFTFIFPYNTKASTILYRCWLKKWTKTWPVVNHIGIHYNLNYKQELLFNYQIDLNKSYELLNGREVEKDRQNDKLLFLKDIWQNQDMVELIDVTGRKYTCIPFSDDRTPWQGLVISTANANGAIKDLDNLVYKVAFWLKTIANYEKIL